MQLTTHQLKILNAEICPYCGCETKIVDEFFIYGKQYKNRNVICCVNFPKCDSYVGTHEDGSPLGRLADKELRSWKKSAHKYFDAIWKEELKDRSELYKDMSLYLGIPSEYTHIGMFQKTTCRKVIYWASNLYHKLKVECIKQKQLQKSKDKLLNILENGSK